MLGQETVKIPFLGTAGCVTGPKYLLQTAGAEDACELTVDQREQT
jgi:hypothetical protein